MKSIVQWYCAKEDAISAYREDQRTVSGFGAAWPGAQCFLPALQNPFFRTGPDYLPAQRSDQGIPRQHAMETENNTPHR